MFGASDLRLADHVSCSGSPCRPNYLATLLGPMSEFFFPFQEYKSESFPDLSIPFPSVPSISALPALNPFLPLRRFLCLAFFALTTGIASGYPVHNYCSVMSSLHEEYHVGMLLGYSPVPCIMCNIRSALDCSYCGGSMVRMVPPGYTSEQAVRLPRLRYADLPASASRPQEPVGSSSGARRGSGQQGAGGQSRSGSES